MKSHRIPALLTALALMLSLTACGGGNANQTPTQSNADNSVSDRFDDRTSSGDSSEPDTSTTEPASTSEPTPGPTETPTVPAEMTYTFDTATGTLTCSGGGTIEQSEWIEVVKNALFETNTSICKEEVKAVVIEDGVTGIGIYAFNQCRNLADVTIPNSVTSIDSEAFSETAITGIQIPDSVTTMGEQVFEACWSLTSANIPSHLTEIPNSLFACCSLTSIQIPESVTSIGDEAFDGCSLTEVTIPDSVTSLGYAPFSRCPLKELIVPASVTSWSDSALICGVADMSNVTILCEATMDNVKSLVECWLPFPVTIHAPAGSVVEGYVNRQIESGRAKCTFVPIN